MENKKEFNFIDPVTIGTAAALAQKVPAVANVVAKIAPIAEKVGAIVGVGGVSQDRFIERTLECDKIFDAAGYQGIGEPGAGFTKHKLRKTQVTDKKKNGNYQAEFDRLHAYIVERMNTYNPGLGNAWAQYFPQFKLANLGNIGDKNAAWLGFKEFVKTYPPGTYHAGEQVVIPTSATTLAKVKEIPDAVEQTNQPASNSQVANKLGSAIKMNTTTIIIGVVVLAIAAYFLFKK